MEWLIVIVLLLAVVVVLRSNQKRDLAQVQRENLETGESTAVHRLVEEDIAALAVELESLDRDLDGRPLDASAAADRRRAAEDLAMARESLAAMQGPAEIRNATMILADGRYAIACVRARVAGLPLPPRRPPCFFDPQHGPSVRDVRWRPEGAEPRDVPACGLDAERVEAGSEPRSRQVMVGSRPVPYWEAGAGYAPWAAGYFAAFGVLNVIFVGTMMGAMVAGFDQYPGGDVGGGDLGGGDFGGGDFGGGDFGGGDFGGGDFGGF